MDEQHPRTDPTAGAQAANPFLLAWEPGHFYSPLPAPEEIAARTSTIFHVPRGLPDIALREEEQLELLDRLARFYVDQPFTENKTEARRYYFDNPNFRHGEAISLYCMMRHLRPSRIIEIGSGHSSCAMLDVNELFFADAITCTFVEPYPDLLYSLLLERDRTRVSVVPRPVQDVDLDLFSQLADGDILFIDSSHVCKIGSDVNHILFSVLPRLREGVMIHIHDIYYPFEYPREWVAQGRAWTEAYLVRAFLQHNNAYRIELFNSFLGYFHREAVAARMPLCGINLGSSLWIRKTAPASPIPHITR